MDSNQLAVERAAWIVMLKQELKARTYDFREHVNDFKTFLVVTHAKSPGWRVNVAVCSAHNSRNRLEIDESVLSYSCKAHMRMRLVEILDEKRVIFDASVGNAKQKEIEAATWETRQEQELAGLEEVKGVSAEIIRSGPRAGEYGVTLLPGNPLENLTLDQFKSFHRLLLGWRNR